ncbi:MAG: M16 family metallopeptidase [Puniceicoccaceae bacterium]
MNKLKSNLSKAVAIFAVVFMVSLAQARPWPQEGSDLPVDQDVQWGHLENGIRTVILPWSEPPERISLRLMIESGSINESERQKGLAHLIEHMAFNGTRNYSAGEMVEYFQRLGMDFGADTNAHTWWRETVYKLELPDRNEELLRDGLQLLRDYADGMLFEEEELEKEKGVVLSEFRDGNSPQFKEYIDGIQFVLPDSRISQRITIGDEDVLRMATRQDILDYYNKWYVPEKMVLIAVGEVDPAQIMELFNEYFGDMEPSADPVKDPDYGTIVPVEQKFRLYSDPELPQGQLEIYTRRKIELETDTKEMRLERTKVNIANSILSRRFEKISKEENAPLISGSGYDYRWLDFVRYSGVALNLEPVKWLEAMQLATAELNRALQYGFTQAELDEAKATIVNAYEEAAARASTRKSRDLSSALVRSVRDGKVFTDPELLKQEMVKEVKNITLDDVWTAFRIAWSPEERLVSLTGNFESIVQDVFNAAVEVPVVAKAEEEQKPWAYTDFGKPATVVENNYIEDLDIDQYVLSNGVRLNIKKTDYEANKIHVKLSFGTGQLSEPKDKPGLAFLASSIFTGGGLGEHSNDELQALMAGKTVGVGFSVDGSEFTLGGVTNADDLVTQLQLTTAYMSDPGFRPEGRRLFLRQLDGFYTQLAHEPNAILQNEAARFLASGDKRFGFPVREVLEARTTEEAAAWLKDALTSGYLEMAVVGDIADKESVIKAVCETIGALPQRADERPELPEARLVDFPRGADNQVFTYKSEIPRAMATMNWPTTDQDDIFEVRRLSVLSSVYTDRMRVEIREKIGEAYSPYAYNSSSDTFTDYGVFKAIVGVKPESADKIEGILLDIGEDIAENGISDDELVRAIEPVKSRIEEYRRTNGYWLNSVLLRCQDEPRRIEWARSFAEFWGTVTVEDMNRLAKTYLKPDSGIAIQVQPES